MDTLSDDWFPSAKFLVNFISQPATFRESSSNSNSNSNSSWNLSKSLNEAASFLGPYDLEAKKFEVGWCLSGLRILSYCFSDLDEVAKAMESSLIAEEQRQRSK